MSADKMTARRNLATIPKESANKRGQYNCCTRREASLHPQVDASTDSWRISQGVNPPTVHRGPREGFIRLKFFINTSRGREVLK